MCSLGLDTVPSVNSAFRETSFIAGIQLLTKYHFMNSTIAQRADLVGKLMFNGLLFGRDAANEVATKITKSVTLCIFSSVALLRSIGSHGGALNDTMCDQYARIEQESGVTNMKKGNEILHKRWKIAEVRAIGNDFVQSIFDIKHDPDSKYGNYVQLDLERSIRFLLSGTGTTERAVTNGFEITSCADGAEVCGKHKTSQTCVGLKPIDLNSIDLSNNEPLFAYTEETVMTGLQC